MKRLVIIPVGWPCTLGEAPPGPFIDPRHGDLLCFKSEYNHNNGQVMAYNSAGEFFCAECNATIVQPVEMQIEEFEP